MSIRPQGRFSKADRGVLLLELAIFLPLIIFFLFSIVGFGMSYREQIKLIEALSGASRAAQQIFPDTQSRQLSELCGYVKETVDDLLAKNGFTTADYSVEVKAINLDQTVPIAGLSSCYRFGIPAFQVTVERTNVDSWWQKMTSSGFGTSATAIIVTRYTKVTSGSC